MQRIAVALALALIALPVGAGAGPAPDGRLAAIEQHTSYVQLVGYEPTPTSARTAIAGLVACQPDGAVAELRAWFHALANLGGTQRPDTRCLRDNGTDHVWATLEGAPDPRAAPTLSPTGDVLSFTDPNGMPWTVTEYVYYTGAGRGAPHLLAWHAWVAGLGAPALDPTIAGWYNFVVVVDVDKLGDPARSTVDVHLWTGPAPGGPYEEGADLGWVEAPLGRAVQAKDQLVAPEATPAT